MAELQLFWLLLPAAAASGWLLARRPAVKPRSDSESVWQHRIGLDVLNWEAKDSALDAWLRRFEDVADTVEARLAIANYFRHKGDVDRAIRIHRELMNQQGISTKERQLAALELGTDFMRSGLLDRAEQTFKGVVSSEPCSQHALSQLIDIYQQEQDWSNAISCAEQLQERCGTDTRALIAQFLCESAEQSLSRHDDSQAATLLQRALKIDPRCVRVSFIEGRLALQRCDYDRALAAYLRVETQDSEFVQLALPLMLQCYRALNRLNEFKNYLTVISRRQAGGPPTLLLADLIAEHHGSEDAVEFLMKQLDQGPSLGGVEQILRYLRVQASGPLGKKLEACISVIEALVRAKTGFQCRACGFETQSLYWQCPGCKHWASVKPTQIS